MKTAECFRVKCGSRKCYKLWDTDGRHLLQLCCDNITEYDPDEVFEKKAYFQNVAFLMTPTDIQVLIQ